MEEIFKKIIGFYNGQNNHGEIAQGISELTLVPYAKPSEIDVMIAKNIMESYNDYFGQEVYTPSGDALSDCKQSLEALNVLLVNNTSKPLAYGYLNILLPLFAPIIYSYNTLEFTKFLDKANLYMKEIGSEYISLSDIKILVTNSIKNRYENKAMFCVDITFDVVDGERSYSNVDRFFINADIDKPHDTINYYVQKYLLDSGLRPNEDYDEDYDDSYEEYVTNIKCFWSYGYETSTSHGGSEIINFMYQLSK